MVFIVVVVDNVFVVMCIIFGDVIGIGDNVMSYEFGDRVMNTLTDTVNKINLPVKSIFMFV